MLLADMGLVDKAKRYMVLVQVLVKKSKEKAEKETWDLLLWQAFVKAVPQNRLSDVQSSFVCCINARFYPVVSGNKNRKGRKHCMILRVTFILRCFLRFYPCASVLETQMQWLSVEKAFAVASRLSVPRCGSSMRQLVRWVFPAVSTAGCPLSGAKPKPDCLRPLCRQQLHLVWRIWRFAGQQAPQEAPRVGKMVKDKSAPWAL